MRCPKCGRENPTGVAFCVFCGQPLERGEASQGAAKPLPAEAATARPPEPRKAPPPAWPAHAPSPTRPAFRPFGVILIAVYQALQAPFWLLIGQSLYLSQITAITGLVGIPGLFGIEGAASGLIRGVSSLVGGRAIALGLLLVLVTLLIQLTGLLMLVGAIGLWLMTAWGRRVIIWVQAPTMIVNLGMLLLILLQERNLSQPGPLLLLLIWPIIGLILPILIVAYLIQPGLDRWFQEG